MAIPEKNFKHSVLGFLMMYYINWEKRERFYETLPCFKCIEGRPDNVYSVKRRHGNWIRVRTEARNSRSKVLRLVA